MAGRIISTMATKCDYLIEESLGAITSLEFLLNNADHKLMRMDKFIEDAHLYNDHRVRLTVDDVRSIFEEHEDEEDY